MTNAETYVYLHRSIVDHFGGDAAKAMVWFNTENPLLGGVTPSEMIYTGRIEKLKKFVDNALEENNP